MPHDPTKEGKEYISAREAAKMLGITTGALRTKGYSMTQQLKNFYIKFFCIRDCLTSFFQKYGVVSVCRFV